MPVAGDAVQPVNGLDALLCALEAGQHVHGLTDPSAGPGDAARGSDQRSARIANRFVDVPATQQLRIQRLPDDPVAVRRAVSEALADLPVSPVMPRAVCGWLVASVRPEAIAGYLGRQLAQRTSDGRHALLRFHDPRILARLVDILTPRQLSILLGPVDGWYFPDHTGRVIRISPHEPLRSLGRLTLSESQWGAIRRIARLNRCIEFLEQDAERQKLENEPAVIDRLIEQAAGFGLSGGREIIEFVAHGVRVHPEFHRHPRMRSLLNECGGKRSYSVLVKRLGAADWQAIREDMEVEAT
ncbi:hypothetical protein KBTX_03550 [wastewater metagenome]|uniref:DUF4123 domain-containing protein n=2 Tax=unclassified sequences TaxID=12908 RepID=A0A5B8RGP2_9ZZZZ|nr:hypothetical protein KBTEX_03550 [uncultured organism]